ncbi:MAG TPA: hypothetical protein VM677_28300 [Actinokineospora sp.]|jgi:excisionase family DNA binding protein|nr:hypothetical protein [Actinokineospora sp.]
MVDDRLPGYMPVSKAAERLKVSPERVRELVGLGQLAAVRPGRELLVRADSVHRRANVVRPQAGRPLSPRMAWAVLASASGNSPDWVSSAELVRVRRYVQRPLDRWPHGLARRADLHPARILPAVLKRVREMPGVAAGGVAAAIAHGSNLVGAADETVDLYVSSAVYEELRGAKGIRWDSEDPTVIVRVLSAELAVSALAMILGKPVVPVAAAAADLLDQGDERAVHAASELLRVVGVRQ